MLRIRAVLIPLALVLAPVGAGVHSADAQVSSTPRAVNGAKITKNLRDAVAHLHVSGETRRGYDRDQFRHWIDVNHDCQDTRAEVLISESLKRTTGTCTIKRGKWISAYDRRTFYNAGDLDVDHLVPLAEAWDSGARGWTAAKREAYANDLTERRSLIAVSASSNRSKGDRDPAEWLPGYGKCRYALQWTVVKLRWGLMVDPAEKARLIDLVRGCSDVQFTTYKAVVVNGD